MSVSVPNRVPWEGEAEWFQRQVAQGVAAKKRFVAFMAEHPDARCVSCSKEMTKLGEGRIVRDADGNERPRCLDCQRRVR